MTYTLTVTNKTIDTSPIRHKNIQGEHNVNKVVIPLPLFYGDIDLSLLTYSVKGLYANGEEAIDSLTVTVTAEAVELAWTISNLFTNYSGDLSITVIGTDADNSPLIKFIGDKPLVIKSNPSGTNLSLDVVEALKTDVTTLKTETIAVKDEAVEAKDIILARDTAAEVYEPYDPTKAYVPMNNVTYEGSSYRNTVACTGVLPTVTDNWLLIAAKGIDGTDGTSSYQAAVLGGYTGTEAEYNAQNALIPPHMTDKENPHEVTKTQVGLANVDNTTDALKPVSTAQQAALDLKSNKAQEAWITPTLLNGWVNAGGTNAEAGYYKDNFGVVQLKGVIKSGTTTALTALFTLPIQYRVLKDQYYPVVSNGSFGFVMIRAGGAVAIYTGNAAYLSLDGISFRVEA